MSAVWVTAYALLSAGAALSIVRVWLGPSLLDRVVATETLLAIIAAGVAVHAALARDAAFVPVLLVVALLAFIGATSVARYVGGMPIQPGDDDGRAAGPPLAAEPPAEGR